MSVSKRSNRWIEKAGPRPHLVAKDAQLIAFLYLPKLGESELRSPDLTLAAKTVRSDQLEPNQ